MSNNGLQGTREGGRKNGLPNVKGSCARLPAPLKPIVRHPYYMEGDVLRIQNLQKNYIKNWIYE